MICGQQDRDRALIEKHNEETMKTLRTLIGKTIMGVEYVNTGEGEFILYFIDGCTATFSACGDDMTFATLSVGPK